MPFEAPGPRLLPTRSSLAADARGLISLQTPGRPARSNRPTENRHPPRRSVRTRRLFVGRWIRAASLFAVERRVQAGVCEFGGLRAPLALSARSNASAVVVDPGDCLRLIRRQAALGTRGSGRPTRPRGRAPSSGSGNASVEQTGARLHAGAGGPWRSSPAKRLPADPCCQNSSRRDCRRSAIVSVS